jgi:hypothetical protein
MLKWSKITIKEEFIKEEEKGKTGFPRSSEASQNYL